MKCLLLSLSLMLFSLLGHAADAQTQVRQLRDTVTQAAPAREDSRGPASTATEVSGDGTEAANADPATTTESQSPGEYNRNSFFISSGPSLSNSVGVYRPDKPASPSKKRKNNPPSPPAENEAGVGQ